MNPIDSSTLSRLSNYETKFNFRLIFPHPDIGIDKKPVKKLST